MLNLNKNIITVIKFLSVGSLGTVTNLTIFYFLVDHLNYNYNYVIVLAFLIGGCQNYVFNNNWTFKEKSKELSLKNLIKYISINVLSLILNLLIFNSLNLVLEIDFLVIIQAISIFAGAMVNFLGAKFYVFK